MIQDQANVEFITACADAAIAAGLQCFQCLARRMSGCYPETLLAVCLSKGLTLEPCEWHALERGWDVPLASSPFPHVVDGDWRYSRPTASKLLDLVVRNVGKHATCVHIGSPSTYRAALSAYPEAGKHILHDRNAFLHDPNATVMLDGGATADAAILDPPWYPDDTLTFLRVAAGALRDDALVLLAQPGRLTRPNVEQERETILEGATAFGYAWIHTLPDYVRYEMPHFEFVTLRRTIDQRVPADWRTGDLLLLRFDSAEDRLSGEELPSQGGGERWADVSLGPVRYKYRRTETSDTLGCLTSDGMARTVSRRDPLRPSVGVWSTGNRIYTCGNPAAFLHTIHRLNRHLLRAEFTQPNVVSALQDCHLSEDGKQSTAQTIIGDVMEHLQHA